MVFLAKVQPLGRIHAVFSIKLTFFETFITTRSNFIVWDKKEYRAWSLSYNGRTVFHSGSNRRRILPFLISAGYSVISAGVNYWANNRELKDWDRSINNEIGRWTKLYDELHKMLDAKCSDGSYKIKDNATRECLRHDIEQ